MKTPAMTEGTNTADISKGVGTANPVRLTRSMLIHAVTAAIQAAISVT